MANSRATQIGDEYGDRGTGEIRDTSIGAEYGVRGLGKLRATQIGIEWGMRRGLIGLNCPPQTPQLNVPYSSALQVNTGTPVPHLSFSIIAGHLPMGLALDPSTGVISGTPISQGAFSYTAQVEDLDTGVTATVTCTGNTQPGGGGGGGGALGSCRTQLHLWQLARVPKPETIENRFGDWYDFGQASYIRGVIIRADTFGQNKAISIRNGDTGALVNFSGGPSEGVINHSGEQETAYYFNNLAGADPPFVAHLVREEPQDFVPWRKFQIEWIRDPWPELTALDSPWMNLGAEGAKYLRGAVIPMDTNGEPVELTFLSSDGGTRTVGQFTTPPAEKTSVGWAFDSDGTPPTPVPLIGHDYQLIPSGPIRVWYEQIRWDFDSWPELIREKSGWMPLRAGGGASFLQGLILPLESDGVLPQLAVLTDTGLQVNLTTIVTPPLNVKTGVPFSLTSPVVCHQVQLIVLSPNPCRVWLNEIQWVSEATAELAANWISQWTGHGLKGYQHIGWIEAHFATQATATLVISVYDGTAPTPITLPNTAGVRQKALFSLTFNKFQLAQYSCQSTAPFQLFLNDWAVYIGEWGRSGEYLQYRNLGGEMGDKARI